MNISTLSGPVTQADVDRIQTGDAGVLHVTLPLADADLGRIAGLLAARPDLLVRIHRAGGEPLEDLEVLAHLPTVRWLQLDTAPDLRALDGLRHVPDLERLFVTRTHRPVSLRPLEALSRLRTLTVVGPHRDLDALGALASLDDLVLRSVPRPDLRALAPLRGLRSVELKLGSAPDLTPLADLEGLEHLEIWRVQGLRDLAPLGDLRRLRLLELQALGKVERLPDMGRCAELRGVRVEALKAITDLRPLLAAPNLERLQLFAMPQLRWEHVAPAKAHPRLRAVTVGTGSARRNAEIQARLGLPLA